MGEAPIELALALCNFLGGIVEDLHGRAVLASEIEERSERLDDLLSILADKGINEGSRVDIVRELESLRDLL